MKFSERISNQSTSGRFSRMWREVHGAQADADAEIGKAPAVAGGGSVPFHRGKRFRGKMPRGPRTHPWPPGPMVRVRPPVLHGNRAAALALAGVLASAAAVAGLAAARTLAGVHALARVLRIGRGAAALALAGVLAGAAAVASLTAALALAGVLSLAHVLVRGGRLVLGLLLARGHRLLVRRLGVRILLGNRQAGTGEHAGDRETENIRGQITLLHQLLLSFPVRGSPSPMSRHGCTGILTSMPLAALALQGPWWGGFYPQPTDSVSRFAPSARGNPPVHGDLSYGL